MRMAADDQAAKALGGGAALEFANLTEMDRFNLEFGASVYNILSLTTWLTTYSLPERLNLIRAGASFVSMLVPIPSSSGRAHKYHRTRNSCPKGVCDWGHCGRNQVF